MKVMLTLRFDGNRRTFVEAMLRELRRAIDSGDARRAALDVRADGDELATVKVLDTEADVNAVVSLWEAASSAKALALPLPGRTRLIGAYAVDEVVQRDYERTWGAGEVSPGIKCVCLVRRRPSLTREAYSEHWRLRHGPLALEHQPGFWHYVQNHITRYLTPATPDIDGIGELHYRSADAVETSTFASPESVRLIMEDTERFLDRRASTTVPTKEHLVP